MKQNILKIDLEKERRTGTEVEGCDQNRNVCYPNRSKREADLDYTRYQVKLSTYLGIIKRTRSEWRVDIERIKE